MDMTQNTRSTTEYKQFSFLMDNRQTARAHVNKLKLAIKEKPEILEVQPILVNEKMEIIDGQHRFVAASELGVPVHFTIVDGLDIDTARDMNVLQRKWNVDDYAYSYAKAGNLNYRAFNEYRQEYPGLPATVLMIVMSGADGGSHGMMFRTGRFVMKRAKTEIDWILEKLIEIRTTVSGAIPINKAFVTALMQSVDKTEFDIEEFIRQLQTKPEMYHRTSTVRDALRMIEDIYNYRKSVNLIRLY
jgi:hypothetical protein